MADPEPIGALFCSEQLAARVERAEAGLIVGGVEGALRRDPEGGHLAREIAGGWATWAGEGSPLNKVVGLGFGGPVSEAELAAVEREMAQRGAPVRVELSSLAGAGIAEMLSRRGYRLVGFENVLGLSLPAARLPAHGPAISVELTGEGEHDLWMSTVVDGFAHPDEQGVASDEEFPRDALERVFSDLAAASGFRRYVARREGELAGGASLRLDERGVAQLCGAATLPAHRRCGVQTALLAHRLRDAAENGCDLAVVTTQPGSKSQQNVQRLGFHLLYARAVLVLAPRA